MNHFLRACLVCYISFLFVGCGSDSVLSGDQQSRIESGFGSRADACQVLSGYANEYEGIYLRHEGPDMNRRLSELTGEYKKQMSQLTDQGKWTPLQEIGTSIKLSFLIGQFQGALQSCKIEKAGKDGPSIGCDQAQKLRGAMAELCSNRPVGK